MNTVNLVMAREPLPSGPSVFLAGPTPDKSAPVPSWRPAAIEALAAQWTGEQQLTVLSPESRGGQRADRYEDQVGWETAARAAATAILFWIPRDLRTLPGMTTNVEFGLDVASGKVVLGAPTDCPNPERNRYLIYVARRHGVPVRTTLHGTVTAALALMVTPQAATAAAGTVFEPSWEDNPSWEGSEPYTDLAAAQLAAADAYVLEMYTDGIGPGDLSWTMREGCWELTDQGEPTPVSVHARSVWARSRSEGGRHRPGR
ncbi:nucleoside 2-deoxyribosyltransferase domain-containing protein [Streptomyces pinistramenti]|uniref:nucleoside 2-deoxyribosyltransferase domain-containing protein n=1 Tax=Streptomyces pinistramenti TaxID=2884812 RepID=UPI001D088271|nr:nucleoside 2-deoxyribosyltransferase domain-containing protein [Streptomyces pinistramenti]MCB5910347.1 nucleoside 2-deoxyribosyltransferase domain-containing protein [Streptomyces pinistramenti]